MIRLPRTALRDDGHVFSVGADGRLHRHDVAVVRARGEEVLVRGTLTAGERVCVSNLAGASEGMQVRVREVNAS